MDCSHCGTPLTPSSRFCPGCGLRIEAAMPAPSDHEAPAPDPASDWPAPPAPQPLPPPPPPAAAVPRPAPGQGAGGGNVLKLAAWVAALAVVAGLGVVAARRWMASPPAETTPTVGADASCATESSLKSAPGEGDGVLQVTNKTAEPVVVHWLNSSGVRERWFEVRPGAARNQRTPPTYRWVVARPDGACLAVISGQGSVVVE